MPPPYEQIPSLDNWKSDSFAWFALRSSDHVLLTIDSLIADYHDVNLAAVQRESLYFLRCALIFWIRKLNIVPGNATPPWKTANFGGAEKFFGLSEIAPPIQLRQ